MSESTSSPFTDHPDAAPPDVQPTRLDPFDVPQDGRPGLLDDPTSDQSTSPYHAILAARAAAAEAATDTPAPREPGRLRRLGGRAMRSFIESSPIGAVQDLTRSTPDMIDPSRIPHAKRTPDDKQTDFLAHYNAAAERTREREAAQEAAHAEALHRQRLRHEKSTEFGSRNEIKQDQPTYLEQELQKIAENTPAEFRSYIDPDYINQIDSLYDFNISSAIGEWHDAHPEYSGKNVPPDIFRGLAENSQHAAILRFLTQYGLPANPAAFKAFGDARYAAYVDRERKRRAGTA